MAIRTYGQACGIAHAMDVVGERWAVLVIRELLLGPKRFTDLSDDLPGASPSVLADRLRELEDSGVLAKVRLERPSRAWVYELTEWGRQLEPIVVALGDWGLRSQSFDPDAPASADSVALAIRSYFATSDEDWEARMNIGMDEARYSVHIRSTSLSLVRGWHPDAVATIEGPPAAIKSLFGSGKATEWKGVDVSGDYRSAQRLLASVTPGRVAPR